MSYDIQQSTTAYTILFFLTSSTDHITGLTGATATVKLSKNGGTGVSPSGAVTQIDSTNLPGWYAVAGNATDSNTLGPLALHATATGADPCDIIVGNVIAYNPQSANLGIAQLSAVAYQGVAQAGATSTITLASGTTAQQAEPGDVIVLNTGTGAGQSGVILSGSGMGTGTPVVTMINPWPTTSPDVTTNYVILKVGGTVPSSLAQFWGYGTRTLTAATNITSTGAVVPIDGTGAVSADVTFQAGIAVMPRYVGTAQAGGANTVTLQSGTTALQAEVGDIVILTSGPGQGQSGIIASVAGMGTSTPVATMQSNWPTSNPTNTTGYEILKVGNPQNSSASAIATAVWAAAARTVTAATNITTNGNPVPIDTAGNVTANILEVNSHGVIGNGSTSTPWGPA